MTQEIARIVIRASACFAATLSVIAPPAVHADDSASPCAALKRIVAAAPQHFTSLSPEDGRAVAQPYGDDAQCATNRGTWQCTWSTRDAQTGSGTDALEGVGADIASCLPAATHDGNSPGRQHFYLGKGGSRIEITAQTVGASRVKLTVSPQ
ncbi:hypothetical protein ACFSHT_40210 [Paraburkholderia silviterrae]|uniref:hypothetical protein n=1 Tax=Paraburkholderia silviterrae TaxID=2528715 RepID=UPI001F0FD781|nr:hypothetical protein [Paraburkholderia silviterrae]